MTDVTEQKLDENEQIAQRRAKLAKIRNVNTYIFSKGFIMSDSRSEIRRTQPVDPEIAEVDQLYRQAVKPQFR